MADAIRADIAAAVRLPLECVRVGRSKVNGSTNVSLSVTLDADNLSPERGVMHKVLHVLDAVPGLFFRKDFNGVVPVSNTRVVWAQFTVLEK